MGGDGEREGTREDIELDTKLRGDRRAAVRSKSCVWSRYLSTLIGTGNGDQQNCTLVHAVPVPHFHVILGLRPIRTAFVIISDQADQIGRAASCGVRSNDHKRAEQPT